MVGSGSSGSKFVVNFSIEGSGQADLEKIAKSFKGLNKTIAGSEHGGPVEGKGITAGLDGGLETMEKMAEAGEKLVEFGTGILEAWGGAFETLLHKGGELETMWLRLQTASHKTGEEAFQTMSQAVHLAQKLPFTESELVRLLDAGAVAHLNIMDEVGESYDKIAKKGGVIADLPTVMGEKMSKTKATMASMFADVFAKAGVDSGYRQQAMHELSVWMETGKMGASQLKRILGHDWKEVEAKSKGGHGSAEALQEWLIKHHALGAGEVQMDTFDAALTKFKGILDLVANSILEPGKATGLLKTITKGLQNLYKTIAEFFDEGNAKGKAFLETLKGTFSMVGGWMVYAADKLGKALAFVMEFMGNNPLLVKFAAGMSFVAAAVSIAAGVFVVASAALGGLILALMVMPEVLAAPLALLAMFPPLLLGIGLAVATGIALWQAWEKDLGGIKTALLNVKLLVSALGEALDNWRGTMTKTSEETAQALEKQGMMGAFLKIINVMRQAQVFYEGFMASFKAHWDAAYPKFSHAWDRISMAFTRIGDAVSSILSAFGMMVSTGAGAVDEAANSGVSWGDTIGRVVEMVANAVAWAAEGIGTLISDSGSMIDTFANWYGTLLLVKGAFVELFGMAKAVFNAMVFGWDLVMMSVAPVLDILYGIIKALVLINTHDFKGAAKAIGDGIKSAIDAPVKYAQAATEHAQAAAAGWETAKDGANQMSEAQGKQDKFKQDAHLAYGALRAERGGEVPTTPALLGPEDLAKKWEASKHETKTKETVDRAMGRGQMPPFQLNANLVIDKQVLARVSQRIDQDEHESGAGHTHGAR